jgi:hypothetical protein
MWHKPQFNGTHIGKYYEMVCGSKFRHEVAGRELNDVWEEVDKVKVNFTLEQATKAQKESRCIALLFL